MKEFKVGVFPRQGKTKILYSAYTHWYNPSWEGCIEVSVFAENGTEAKKKAIEKVKKMED